MGFESISKRVSFRKLTDLKQGEQLVGFVTNITDSTKIEGQKNLHMVIDGVDTIVSPAGNVRYMITDGKVVKGLLTRITRLDDKMIKGKKSTQYEVEQDASKVFTGEPSFDALVSDATEGAAALKTSSKINSLKNAAKV